MNPPSRRRQLSVLVAAMMSIAAVSPGPLAFASQKRSAWHPRQADRWIYQLGEETPALDICVVPHVGGKCVQPSVWVLDLYGEDGRTPNRGSVERIHARGGHAVCYVSAGTWEDWRPDARRFPSRVLGTPVVAWPGERWLDIRQLNVVSPLLRARAEKCHEAGFDAIDWDNVDTYMQKSGFAITAKDQLAFNKMLAKTARELGLTVGLKNDLAQARVLEPHFDFVVSEECQRYQECGLLAPFALRKKAVVQIEYGISPEVFCPASNTSRRSAMQMDLALTADSWKPCR